MKGLKLCFKKKEISASISNGSLHVIIGQKIENNGEHKTTLDFTGLDKDKNEFIDWYKSELSTGDKIIIEVNNIVENSEPISMRKANQQETVIKSKLDMYNRLKKELEDKGLI